MPSRTPSPQNTRRNYVGQYRKFRAWCQGEKRSPLPTSPEVVAAYAAELVDDGKSMSTVRLAVSAIVDAHRRVGLESPVNAGVTETLRGLARRVGASQRQTKPLDADALAAIRAPAFTSRRSRGGSLSIRCLLVLLQEQEVLVELATHRRPCLIVPVKRKLFLSTADSLL